MIGSIGLPIFVDVGLSVRLGSTPPRSTVLSFERFPLDGRIRAGIQSAGYAEPTPIQEQAIPPILEGRDLIGIAQTGTRKTAAFMLPILHHLATHPGRGVRGAVVGPPPPPARQNHPAAPPIRHPKP